MGLYPYNYKIGQLIATDIPGVSADRGFIANLSWKDDETAAADADGTLMYCCSDGTGNTSRNSGSCYS